MVCKADVRRRVRFKWSFEARRINNFRNFNNLRNISGPDVVRATGCWYASAHVH